MKVRRDKLLRALRIYVCPTEQKLSFVSSDCGSLAVKEEETTVGGVLYPDRHLGVVDTGNL